MVVHLDAMDRWHRGVIFLTIVLVLSMAGAQQLPPPYNAPADDMEDDGTDPTLPDDATAGAGVRTPTVERFFVENVGQKGVGAGLYYAEGAQLSVAFDIGGIGLYVHALDGRGGTLVRMGFLSASFVRPRGEDPCGSRMNFIIGNDPGMWHRNATCYRLVTYRSLWDGIDLVFRFEGGMLKYDIIVHPGADPADVLFEYRGADGLEVEDGSGDLLIRVPGQTIRDSSPIARQEDDGPSRRVPCHLLLTDGGGVHYSVGAYDSSKPLVIDPGLVFSTLFGGGRQDSPADVIIDQDDNIYVVGGTMSETFPTTPGSYCQTGPVEVNFDSFIAKFDPSGSRLAFSTFIGGEADDYIYDVTLDGQGAVYVTGFSRSPDFPVTAGAYCATQDMYDGDAYAAKLSPDGSSLVFSMMLGGTHEDRGYCVAADGSGSVIVVGWTASQDFPVTDDALYRALSNEPGKGADIFISQLNGDGSKLMYSTYIGGPGSDNVAGAVLDPEGSIFIYGVAHGAGLPTTAGAYDRTGSSDDQRGEGFIMKFDLADRHIQYSTYVGDEMKTSSLVACFDEEGCAYTTASVDMASGDPSVGGNSTRGYDVRVKKLDANGSSCLLSRTFGGSNREDTNDIEVGPMGNIYIAGGTVSSDLPITSGAYCSTMRGTEDEFLTVLSPDMTTILYSTYFGGSGYDRVTGMAVAGNGDAVMVGDTNLYTDNPGPGPLPKTDFPMTSPPITSGYAVDGTTAYILKLELDLEWPEALKVVGGPVLYAGLRAYDFRVDANPTRAVRPPTMLRMTLDPAGTRIAVGGSIVSGKWAFLPIIDTGNHVRFDSGPSDIEPDGQNSTTFLHFRILFGWDWPDEDPCDVELSYCNGSHGIMQDTYEEAFRVENDLAIRGPVEAKGEWQGPVAEGGWVRASETVTLTGARVVYEGTVDVYPPEGVCNVTVSDDGGNRSSTQLGHDGSFSVSIRAKASTDVDGVLDLSLDELPEGATMASGAAFRLGVDGDAPVFGRAIPEPDAWHSSRDVLISISVHDNATSGVDASSLEFAYVAHGGGAFGPWGREGLESTSDGRQVDGLVSLRLPDGERNLIEWRATDLVGNVGASPPFQIRVDTRNVTFTDPVPDPERWYRTQVDCGVTVRDLNGSGIDVSTIQYRLSQHNLSGYGGWSDIDSSGLEDSVAVPVLVSPPLAETRYNYVQWRAMDLVGHGYTTSPHYRVMMDMTPIAFSEFRPLEGEVLNLSKATCWVTVTDAGYGSGANLSSIEYRFVTSAAPGHPPNGTWSAWLSVGMVGESMSNTFSVKLELSYGRDNIVQFRGSDVAGNGPAESPEYTMTMDDRPPTLKDMSPPPVQKQPGTSVVVAVTVEDGLAGVDPGSIQCRFKAHAGGTLGEWMPMTVTPLNGGLRASLTLELSPGHVNRVQFRARDLAGNEALSPVVELWVNSPPEASVRKVTDPHRPGELVLDAANSTDPDGDRLNFTWYHNGTSGPYAYGSRLPLSLGTLEVGNHTFTVVVTDDVGVADSESVTITVDPPPTIRTRESGDMLWLLLLLVLVITMSGLGVLYIRHRSDGDGQGD